MMVKVAVSILANLNALIYYSNLFTLILRLTSSKPGTIKQLSLNLSIFFHFIYFFQIEIGICSIKITPELFEMWQRSLRDLVLFTAQKKSRQHPYEQIAIDDYITISWARSGWPISCSLGAKRSARFSRSG